MVSLEWFLNLSTDSVIEILKEFGYPQLGVFVPDGSRRLTLAYTPYDPQSDEFYVASASLPAKYVLQSIQTFFDYDLPNLLVPILGRSIIKRGIKYQSLTLLEGLRILFQSEATREFYLKNQIQIHVYGRLEVLEDTVCSPAIEWIEVACEITSSCQKHKLFYAIGESPIVGEDAAHWAASFALKYNRVPTKEEQILAYYGETLPPADFFIMTSKMSGMGALPSLLVNGDTEIYYLPTLMGLNDRNYRLILYDILYNRSALRQGISGFDIEKPNRLLLQQTYESLINEIVGIGFDVGKVWIMQNNKRILDF